MPLHVSTRGRLWGCALVLTVLSASHHAMADESDAERLFREGQELLGKGQTKLACDKFELSLKKEETVSTLVNLAFCHERDGKPGRAWNEFKRASLTAKAERLAFVQQHLKVLDAKVGHASMEVGAHVISDVKLDGEPAYVDPLARITADPGSHSVTVSVDGNTQTLTRDKVVLRLGENNPEITFVFEDAPKPKPPPPPVEHAEAAKATTGDDHGSDPKRTVGFVFMGLGVVGVGIGSYFGVQAFALKPDCTGAACSEPQNAEGRRAVTAGRISTVAFVAGGVALAGGLVLMLTSTSSSKPSAPSTARLENRNGLRLAPVVSASSGGVRLEGSW